jgi:hypothetical protein
MGGNCVKREIGLEVDDLGKPNEIQEMQERIVNN